MKARISGRVLSALYVFIERDRSSPHPPRQAMRFVLALALLACADGLSLARCSGVSLSRSTHPPPTRSTPQMIFNQQKKQKDPSRKKNERKNELSRREALNGGGLNSWYNDFANAGLREPLLFGSLAATAYFGVSQRGQARANPSQ